MVRRKPAGGGVPPAGGRPPEPKVSALGLVREFELNSVANVGAGTLGERTIFAGTSEWAGRRIQVPIVLTSDRKVFVEYGVDTLPLTTAAAARKLRERLDRDVEPPSAKLGDKFNLSWPLIHQHRHARLLDVVRIEAFRRHPEADRKIEDFFASVERWRLQLLDEVRLLGVLYEVLDQLDPPKKPGATAPDQFQRDPSTKKRRR